MNKEFNYWTLGLTLGLGLSTNAAFAQNNSPNLALEEVVVTATKREQSMQDVAVAVTALSESDLRNQQINMAEDLTFLVASLNVQKGANAGNSSFNIRGIGTQAFGIAIEPSVSTMLDGVVLGRSGQAFMQLADVQRVEVLRGPQGTLFGKNATGGVVHIITRNPSDEFTGEIRGTVISDEEYRGTATVSGPITDNLGFRLTASGTDMDGYTRNFYTGNDLNGSEDWTVRGKLRWSNDTLELKWASDYSDREADASAVPMRSLEPFGGNDELVQEYKDAIYPVIIGEENKYVNINREPHNTVEQWGHSLEANWDVGEYTLTSISALRHFETDNRDGFIDVDNLPTEGSPFRPVTVLQGGATDQDQFSQELRITSPSYERFSYVAGLYYFEQDTDRILTRDIRLPGTEPGVGKADFSSENTNWAAFGEATFNINEAWRLILGLRYTEDELDYDFSRERSGSTGLIPPEVDPAATGDTDEDDLSGKLALQWDFSDAGMSYLSYTEGYKGPAYSIIFGTDPDEIEPVDPEQSESWELGLKTSLLDDRLRFNIALFHSTYDNFQAQAFVDPDGTPDCPIEEPLCEPENEPGSFQLINAGEVETVGLEVDFLAQVTANLRVSGGVALVDATIEDYKGGVCSGGQKFRGECPDGLQDLSGGDLPYSPDWKLSLTAAYTWERESVFDMVFSGAVRAQDDVLYGLHQDENTIGDSYAILDLNARLLSHSDHWETSVFVKNVTDEFYPSNILSMNENVVPNGYNHRLSKQAERTYGAEVVYRW